MNFKTTLVEETKPETKYPKIMIDTHSKSVYLMTGVRVGTKITQGNTGITAHTTVGHHAVNWAS